MTAENGAPVTAYGVCWSTTANPTIANRKTVDGTGAGTASSYVNGLATSATYYLRAYATNGLGTAYTFTTTLTIGSGYLGGIVAYFF